MEPVFIGSDGRGTINFNLASAGSSAQTFAFVLDSQGHGQLIWFDSSATGSGQFDVVTPSAFSTQTFTGNWVFRAVGVETPVAHSKPSAGFHWPQEVQDTNIWIIEGLAPTFAGSQGSLYDDGPRWRISLVSPALGETDPDDAGFDRSSCHTFS